VKIGSEPFQQEMLLYSRILPRQLDIALEVVQQLGGLREKFVLYFPDIIKTNLDLVKNPFFVPLQNVADCIKKELIDLRNDSGAKYVFKTNKFCDVCLKVSGDYPNVGKEALKYFSSPAHIYMHLDFLPFST